MSRIVVIFLLLQTLVLQVSCTCQTLHQDTSGFNNPQYFLQQIKQLESANVNADVDSAIARGDFRFLVCIGFGGIVPGVPNWNAQLYKKFGTRILDGTGDMILCKEQSRFKEVAAAYAKSYNERLWLKVGKAGR
jgi:hypothetical protein